MRNCRKNQQIVYYSKFLGLEDVLENGIKTGIKKPSYSKTKTPIHVNIMPTTSINITQQTQGIVDESEYVIVTSESININIDDAIWFNADLNKSHNYIINRIAKTLNTTMIGIKRIDGSK